MNDLITNTINEINISLNYGEIHFEKISLSTGASEIHTDVLTTNILTLKMGAGEFSFLGYKKCK